MVCLDVSRRVGAMEGWSDRIRSNRARAIDMDEDAQIEQAVLANDGRRLRKLLARGVNLGRSARADGKTALHLAAGAGSVEIVNILLEATTRKALNKLDAGGHTPLMDAVEANRLDVLKLLIGVGADVNARDGDRGQTALRIAAGEGSLEVVKVLVEAGANPLIPGPLNLTPVDRARERRTAEGRL